MSKAAEKGRLDAQDEHDAKLFSNRGKKRMVAAVATHIGKAIDRINPLELAAALAGTYVVHRALSTSTEIVNKVHELLVRPSGVEQMLWYGPIVGTFNIVVDWFAVQQAATPAAQSIENQEELFLWALSFFIAYLLVHHFGDIVTALSSLSGGIIGFGKAFLGVAG